MKASKVTVSLPGETLVALERARRRLRKTRSAVVTEALAEWLKSQDVSDADRRYAEAYLRRPERNQTTEAMAAATVGEWDRWGCGRRPVVLVSRDSAYAVRASVTVIEVSTTIRGIASEVALGLRAGLPRKCVANADNIATIPKKWLEARLAALRVEKLAELDAAIRFSLGMS